MRNHRGFTLVEILISLVIMGLVTGSIYKLLTTTQRVSRQQSEKTELQSNIRAGAIIVPSELREINIVPGGGDIQNDLRVISATSMEYRAMRGLGFACQAPTSTEIRLLRSTFSGYRDPSSTDSAYVFLEGANPDASTDDSWVQARISAVATGNVCPGGVAGITLTINPAVPALAGPPAAGIRAPVRIWERMELKLYTSGGKSWLGARSVSAGEATQPVLGPLTDVDGFGLTYLDSTGVATLTLDKVRSIQVTLKGLTDQAITKGTTGSGLAHMRDSLVTQVTLRNALR
jgi:prepilin-type N-terminal cleavage/methylation domain-containing protein